MSWSSASYRRRYANSDGIQCQSRNWDTWPVTLRPRFCFRSFVRASSSQVISGSESSLCFVCRLLAPLSEYVGRRPIYLVSWGLFVIFQIPVSYFAIIWLVLARLTSASLCCESALLPKIWQQYSCVDFWVGSLGQHH